MLKNGLTGSETALDGQNTRFVRSVTFHPSKISQKQPKNRVKNHITDVNKKGRETAPSLFAFKVPQ